MKRSKLFIAAAVAIVAVVALIASACVEVADTQIDDAFKLAASGDYLRVEVSDDRGTFYVYDNGKVTDTYNLGVKFEEVVGSKGEAYAFTESNLKEGYTCEKNTASGKVSIKAELTGTGELGLDGAVVVLEANTVTKEVTTYTVTYTDSNGYRVKIKLA